MKLTIKKSLTFSGWKLQGRMKFQGLLISIENKKGTYRRGQSDSGKKWKTYMNYPYGYIKGTVGKDKDHLDCYVGDNKESEKVFIVHQQNPETKKYDEDKVMLGFDNKADAKKSYLKQYDNDNFFQSMTEMPMEEFKSKVFSDKFKGSMVKSMKKNFSYFLKSEASEGKKVEKEHLGTINKVKSGKLKSINKILQSIVGDHNKEDKEYYRKLISMEKFKDAKGIDKKIINAIKNAKVLDDEKVIHKLAKELNMNAHKLENKIYKLFKKVL